MSQRPFLIRRRRAEVRCRGWKFELAPAVGTEVEIVQPGSWEGAGAMLCSQDRLNGVAAHHLCCGPNPGDPLLTIHLK